jgi:carnosine N-methyltransferase
VTINLSSESVDQWSIFPFIHSFSNLSSLDHLLKEVRFPDVVVPEVLNRQDFGISVGEFTEIFSNPDEHGQSQVTMHSTSVVLFEM